MTTPTGERDPGLRAAYVGVALAAGVLVSGAAAWFGMRCSLSVAVGGALSLTNLWVLERMVRLYLQAERPRWGGTALLKAALVLGLLALLVKVGLVQGVPLLVGFAALPFGIVAGGLWPAARAGEGA